MLKYVFHKIIFEIEKNYRQYAAYKLKCSEICYFSNNVFFRDFWSGILTTKKYFY